jgi:hypothetical protein
VPSSAFVQQPVNRGFFIVQSFFGRRAAVDFFYSCQALCPGERILKKRDWSFFDSIPGKKLPMNFS